jgi:hypothetical protein
MSEPRGGRSRAWIAAARVALWTLGGVALLELAWLGLFGWAEGSGRLRGWMNRRPEKVTVDYGAATSVWPGLVELRDLVVRGRTARGIDWQVEAAAARVQLDLLPLASRTLRIRGAELGGVAVRTRRPPAEGESPSPHAPELRPLRPPAGVAVRPSGRAPRSRPRWTIELRRLRVGDVRELLVDETAVTGGLRGEVGFVLRTAAAEARVLDSYLELDDVAVARRGEPLASGLAGRVDLALSPYRYKEERGRALVPHASGRIRLRGGLDARPLVAELLRRAPWLEIETGAAPLDADLRLRDGHLLAGSRLRAELGAQRVRALDFEIAGDAVLEVAVGGEGRPPAAARWQVGFSDYRLHRHGIDEPLLVGRGLTVSGTAADGAVDGLAERAELALELGESRLPDLGFLAEWLPPAARIERLAGAATVGGRLSTTIAERRPLGAIEVDFERVGLRWAGTDFAGRLETRLEVSGGDLDARWLELDGSRLLLADFTAPGAASAPTRGWWLHLQLPEGGVALGPPFGFQGRFETRLRDTAPLVALFETRRELPRWAERLLVEENVRAHGSLRAGPGQLELDELETEMFGGRLSMRLRFAGEARRGKLLLAWRKLAIGAGFEGARRQIKIDDAREWFAEE